MNQCGHVEQIESLKAVIAALVQHIIEISPERSSDGLCEALEDDPTPTHRAPQWRQ